MYLLLTCKYLDTGHFVNMERKWRMLLRFYYLYVHCFFVSTKMRTMSQQCVNSWQIADLFMDDAFPAYRKNLVENGIFSSGKKLQYIVNSA